MTDISRPPKITDFPPGTEFVIKELDVPLAWIPGPGQGWFNWFGGTPYRYDVTALRVDNNWRAESFEEWVGLVKASMKQTK
jgi:hypothetical protein